MTRRAMQALVLVVVLTATVSVAASEPLAVGARTPAQARGEPLRMLAAGDSYAAGEGLPGIQTGEAACQRALGDESEAGTTPSKAWPVLVKETHEGLRGEVYQPWAIDTFWFTACTGNIAKNFADPAFPTAKGATQLAEAQADAGDEPWDVVTLSFGGNDIGFPDIIMDCIGLELDGDDLGEVGSLVPGVFWDKLLTGAYAGCETTEDELKQRVDQALDAELPALYDEVAGVTAPGGLVVVTGYPQLFEEPTLWPNWNKLRNRCERVSEGDARSIRGATGRANELLGQHVGRAQDANPDQTWLFVDVSQTFEPAEGVRHGLCSAEPWLNGMSFGGITDGDLRALDAQAAGDLLVALFSRSYHPNQDGHLAYSRAVVEAIRQSGWTPAALDRRIDVRNAVLPVGVCGVETASTPPRLVDGTVPDTLDGAEIWLDDESVQLADLDGDGTDDAVATLGCTGGGATGWNDVVVLLSDSQTSLLLPTEAIDLPHESVGARGKGTSIEGGRITLRWGANRQRERAFDPFCCPGVDIWASFEVQDGQLVLVDQRTSGSDSTVRALVDAIRSGDRAAAEALASTEAVDTLWDADELDAGRSDVDGCSPATGESFDFCTVFDVGGGGYATFYRVEVEHRGFEDWYVRSATWQGDAG